MAKREPHCEAICVHLAECVCEVNCGVRGCSAPYDSLLDLVLTDMELEYEREDRDA